MSALTPPPEAALVRVRSPSPRIGHNPLAFGDQPKGRASRRLASFSWPMTAAMHKQRQQQRQQQTQRADLSAGALNEWSAHDGKHFAANVRRRQPKEPQEFRLVAESTQPKSPSSSATSPTGLPSSTKENSNPGSPQSAAAVLRSFWLLDGVGAVRRRLQSSLLSVSQSGSPLNVEPPPTTHFTMMASPRALDGVEAVFEAIAQLKVTPMKAWIAMEGDINARDAKQRTLLHAAAAANCEDAVDALLEAGVFVNPVQATGATPLYFASMAGHTHILSRLIASGADVNLADSQKISPLMQAVRHNHLACVVKLLDAGAEVHVRDAAGNNVLNYVRLLKASAARSIMAVLKRYKNRPGRRPSDIRPTDAAQEV